MLNQAHKVNWLAAWTLGAALGTGVDAADDARSPYVAARLADPVSWQAWAAETPAALRKAGKPVVFAISHEINPLSQAMAGESFANDGIASLVNERFSAVVVDKNEYPALAEFFAICIRARKPVPGWPLTVFTTPDMLLIEGGGYFPPADEWGNPGFSSVVKSISEQWQAQSKIVVMKARDGLDDLVEFHGTASPAGVVFSRELVDTAVELLEEQFDFERGGFSLAPKALDFGLISLLDLAAERSADGNSQAAEMRRLVLGAILQGGARDHVRGGFFSNSTDETWTIPDFRKTAAVQANAIRYLAKHPEHASVALETAQALRDEFRTENGLYAEHIAAYLDPSSKDEDIAAGRAYTWSFEEMAAVLTEDEMEALARRYSLVPEGNIAGDADPAGSFTGRNIFRVNPASASGSLTTSALAKLRAASRARVRVERESVVSVATNALVLSAFVQVGGTAREEFLAEARNMAEVLWRIHFDTADQRLRSASFSGRPLAGEASSLGYALFIQGLLDLAEATGTAEFADKALQLQAVLDERFGTEAGPYEIAAHDDTTLPANLHAFVESDYGSANAVALGNLRRLEKHRPGGGFAGKAEAILAQLPEDASYSPEQFPRLLAAGVLF